MVSPKQWSELTYEMSRGELRMETYLMFLSHLGCSGAVAINFFGGLKPIAAALVSSLHLSISQPVPFIGMLSTMHSLFLLKNYLCV